MTLVAQHPATVPSDVPPTKITHSEQVAAAVAVNLVSINSTHKPWVAESSISAYPAAAQNQASSSASNHVGQTGWASYPGHQSSPSPPATTSPPGTEAVPAFGSRLSPPSTQLQLVPRNTGLGMDTSVTNSAVAAEMTIHCGGTKSPPQQKDMLPPPPLPHLQQPTAPPATPQITSPPFAGFQTPRAAFEKPPAMMSSPFQFPANPSSSPESGMFPARSAPYSSTPGSLFNADHSENGLGQQTAFGDWGAASQEEAGMGGFADPSFSSPAQDNIGGGMSFF